jgi:hypothetical protein
MIKMLLISFIGLILLTGCETTEEKQAKEIMAKKVIEADIKQKEFRESMKRNDERRFTPNLNKDKE